MINYSPSDGLVLSDRIKYRPRHCFIMTQMGKPLPDKLIKIRQKMEETLSSRDITVIDASSKITGKDLLVKIWRQILEVPMGIAILTENMGQATIGNIFYEIALLDSLGKETIVIKTQEFKIPSDFIRTEFIEYDNHFENNLNKYLDNIFEQAEYYEEMAELVKAKPILSIDYLRRAYLITGEKNLIQKAKEIFKKNTFDEHISLIIQNLLNVK